MEYVDNFELRARAQGPPMRTQYPLFFLSHVFWASLTVKIFTSSDWEFMSTFSRCGANTWSRNPLVVVVTGLHRQEINPVLSIYFQNRRKESYSRSRKERADPLIDPDPWKTPSSRPEDRSPQRLYAMFHSISTFFASARTISFLPQNKNERDTGA